MEARFCLHFCPCALGALGDGLQTQLWPSICLWCWFRLGLEDGHGNAWVLSSDCTRTRGSRT
eukprot:8564325-Prorocentrum_lima.AAC.1